MPILWGLGFNFLKGIYKMKTQGMPFALSIAGFDPSGGAGILADIKAFEYFGVYGQSVCTALTIQNENTFLKPGFLSWESILEQLEVLHQVRHYDYIKIGLIPSAAILQKLLAYLREKNPNPFIIWDPIVSASAGYHFFETCSAESFYPHLSKIDLITPNQDEFIYLGLGLADSRQEIKIGEEFSVLLKGGHQEGALATDTLWFQGEKHFFSAPRLIGKSKHGTGCTLSSAILANLTLGKSLLEAVRVAKDYLSLYLQSGESLLGFPKHSDL